MSIQVSIVMGSKSDLPIMEKAKNALAELGIEAEMRILSAHRTPDEAVEYAKSCRGRGVKVIIAGAGGAAHLPGVMAGISTLPVVGVPINSSNSVRGIDSLLAIVQMPSGVPVATVAIDGATNAGILAAQIIGVADENVAAALDVFKETMRQKVLETDQSIQ